MSLSKLFEATFSTINEHKRPSWLSPENAFHDDFLHSASEYIKYRGLDG
jgi:hypothetical protein